MLRTKARRSISTIHEEFQMTLTRSLPIVLAFGIVGVPAWSAQDDQHQAHHPAGSASAPASKTMPGKSGAETARMDTQMKTMGAMHDRMMAAKTPEERNALMPEHMKAMQGGMAMMAGMAPGAMPGMNGDVAAHQTMEKRMEMMQAMMQMMMDRLPAAPVN